MADKLWGGRFSTSPNQELEKLNSSINIDKELYAEDIAGSIAYAKSLVTVNLLTEEERDRICDGLNCIKKEWDEGSFIIKKDDEDIHTANERRLKELIGEPATKLHVGRSRNDQVATDMKLWLRSRLTELKSLMLELINVTLERSAEEVGVLMPGYTHLQRAQPVRWSHWLLSHAWSLKNDVDRLQEIKKRVNIMPLGSGALAGNPFNIDRKLLAASLNFAELTHNSMQAVSDRDFIAEFLFWASLTGVHMSRWAEDLIIFCSKEFGYVTIDEAFSTGSSLMPQKRNPDSLELIRGIGGGLFGKCCSLMMTMKGLPSTYNKDMQGDKSEMFAAFQKLQSILKVATGVIKTLKLNEEKCQGGLSVEMLATDIAYYLVRKGLPFRKAHHIAGQVVAHAEKSNVPLQSLSYNELKSISEHFSNDFSKIWNYENSVEQYQAIGGTSKRSVLNQIEELKKWMNETRTL
ncbi:hypothetical protein PPYR_12246 [Photinus pyralis]|uniref:Argininosuccinate lyase n=3 Tax=Photinus pyralis TaxID=7054 RepID=A0A1Y1LD32_PHOPY|nr:argininosuccinate lyase isoform X3 [Photinus pyralis]KAB0795407.1 hypothetical protein PPYR_12246 [Photinus pyralis]